MNYYICRCFVFLLLTLSAGRSHLISAEPKAISPQEKETEGGQSIITKMDALIEATKESTIRLEKLKQLLLQYKEKEKEAINNPDDTDNLMRLVNAAKALDEVITENSLQEYFPPQFLQELKKLSHIADKRNIPPAK